MPDEKVPEVTAVIPLRMAVAGQQEQIEQEDGDGGRDSA